MSISAVVRKKEDEKFDWTMNLPHLVISDAGRIVLATTIPDSNPAYFRGFLIYSPFRGEPHRFFNAWIVRDFKPINGTITLSNDL